MTRWGIAMAGLVCLSITVGAGAQSDDAKAKDTPKAAAGDAAAKPSDPAKTSNPGNPGSAQDVMDRMINQVEPNAPIEPTQRPRQPENERPPLDPRILGHAPGTPKPKLRAEGEFVVSRRGRISRAPDGVHILFVFESDEKDAPEAPMILVPCQWLQSMEDIIRDRGDRIVFKLSGQVLAYRGLNYLLPTMFTVDFDRGNLQP